LKLELLANKVNIVDVLAELKLFSVDILSNYTCFREELTTIHNKQYKLKYVNLFAKNIYKASTSQYTK